MKNWHLWPEALPDLLVALLGITLQQAELCTLFVTFGIYAVLAIAVVGSSVFGLIKLGVLK